MKKNQTQSMPKKMQALELLSPGKFEIREKPVPTPGQGEVLCKIRAVAICGSDPEIIRGDLAGTWPPGYPFTPGHEWAGEVVALGGGVSKFKVGDRVAGEAHKGCGYCRNCLEGKYNLCLNYGNKKSGHAHYGFNTTGAYAQYNAVSVKAVSLLSEGVSFSEGALIDTAGAALHGMELSGITEGGNVVIVGPGPIGLIAMRLAKALGAGRVIVVGRGMRLQKAGAFGADALVNFEETDPLEAVLELTNGDGADELFECSGAKDTLNQGIKMVCKGGAVVLLGIPATDLKEEIAFRHIVHNQIRILGSRANPNVAWKVNALIAAKQLQVSDLITHTFPLTQFEEALQTFLERRDGAVKVVVQPNGPEGLGGDYE